MTDEEIVKATIRWIMTTSEVYSSKKPEDIFTVRLPGCESWLSFPYDRVGPGELLPRSHAHREARILARQDAAVLEVLGVSFDEG